MIWDSEEEKVEICSGKRQRDLFCKRGDSDGAKTHQAVLQWGSKVWINPELCSVLPVSWGVLCQPSLLYPHFGYPQQISVLILNKQPLLCYRGGFFSFSLTADKVSHPNCPLTHTALSQEHRTPFQTPPKLSLVILPTAFVNDKELSWVHSTKKDKLESSMVYGRKYIKWQNRVYHMYFDLLSPFFP